MRRYEPASSVIVVVARPAKHDKQSVDLDRVDAEHNVDELLTVIEMVELIVNLLRFHSIDVHDLG